MASYFICIHAKINHVLRQIKQILLSVFRQSDSDKIPLDPIQIDDKQGHADKNGKIAIEPPFEQETQSEIQPQTDQPETQNQLVQEQPAQEQKPTEQPKIKTEEEKNNDIRRLQGLIEENNDDIAPCVEDAEKFEEREKTEGLISAEETQLEDLKRIVENNRKETEGYQKEIDELNAPITDKKEENPQTEDKGENSQNRAVKEEDTEKHGSRRTMGTATNEEKESMSAIYDEIKETSPERLAAIKLGDKWGYIDKNGKMAINPQFEDSGRVKEGRAGIELGGKDGYINKTEKIAIKPKLDDVGRVKEGRAEIELGEKDGYINKTEKIAIKPKLDDVGRVKEGLAGIGLGGKDDYADKTEKITIKSQFYEADDFQEGLARIRPDDKWGYIDKNGKIAISPQFDSAWGFKEGLAGIKIV